MPTRAPRRPHPSPHRRRPPAGHEQRRDEARRPARIHRAVVPEGVRVVGGGRRGGAARAPGARARHQKRERGDAGAAGAGVGRAAARSTLRSSCCRTLVGDFASETPTLRDQPTMATNADLGCVYASLILSDGGADVSVRERGRHRGGRRARGCVGARTSRSGAVGAAGVRQARGSGRRLARAAHGAAGGRRPPPVPPHRLAAAVVSACGRGAAPDRRPPAPARRPAAGAQARARFPPRPASPARSTLIGARACSAPPSGDRPPTSPPIPFRPKTLRPCSRLPRSTRRPTCPACTPRCLPRSRWRS